MTLSAFCLIPSGEMHIKFTLSHRTRLPASVIATSLPLYFITDLQLAHKETTYWPKYTIKCVGFSIRLPYTTETINLAKPLGNNIRNINNIHLYTIQRVANPVVRVSMILQIGPLLKIKQPCVAADPRWGG